MIFSVPEATITNILTFEYIKRIKQVHSQSGTSMNEYYYKYKEALENREDPGIIVRIACGANLPPCFVGKLILKKHLKNAHSEEMETEDSQANITKYLRDTSLINNMDLAYEIFLVSKLLDT